MALDHDSWLLLYAAPGLGVVTSNATFVSPLAHVRRARASGDFSSINAAPFAAIVANCMGWCAYAFGTRDWFVFWSNAPGVLLGLFFVSSAMQHTKCSSLLARLERQLLVQTAVTLVGGAVAAIALRDADRAMSVLGAVAVFHLLVFYSAPLSDVVNILKQRDSSSLLWPLIATSAVNGLLWVGYGLALSDFFIAGPNAFGVLLAVFQAALKLRLPSRPARALPRSASQEPLQVVANEAANASASSPAWPQ